MRVMAEWLASIGMEVHAELNTASKMFCRCPVAFGGSPNSRVCPVCLGLPGALPVPNRAAIERVARTALALHCTIARHSVFHRKNYFYPDLPKGYQISQYGETNPIGYHGSLDIRTSNGIKTVRIRRVHLEEDTGKLFHLPGGDSGIDFNRSGVPLMEIVTDFPPDIETAEEAKEYLVQLRQVLLYLDVCDGKMEEGSLRCEPNISIRPRGGAEYGTKTELKNLNSFRSVQLGIEFEVRRQRELLESGGTVLQETRGWNEGTESSFAMRIKEFENDYRYFPEPDIPPMTFDEPYIEGLANTIPELPLSRSLRYERDFGLSAYDATLLVAELDWAEFFEKAVALGGHPKSICNWMNADFARLLNNRGLPVRQSKVTPAHLVDLSRLIDSGAISGKIAKDVFEESFESARLPSEIVSEGGRTQISDRDQVAAWCEQSIAENPQVLAKYKSGQESVAGFFVGQVMKKSEGRANPALVQEVLKEVLAKL